MTAFRYNNTSVPVVLVSGINDVDDTLTVGSTASYPQAPFLLGVDRGTSEEEVMLCTAKTSTTFTVTRGYDGTTAVAHNIGAIVEHSSTAISHRRGAIAQVTTAERDALASVDLWNGRTVWNTDTSKLQYYTGSAWANVGPRTGAIEMFGGASAPPGTLLCQGQSVSQTTYADLFAVIGTTFGDPGGGNFNLPDLRQRFPVGAQAGGDYDLGDTGGSASVALSTSEMPSHTHTGPSHTHTGPSHFHSIGNHSHTSGNIDADSAGNHSHTPNITIDGVAMDRIEWGGGTASSPGTVKIPTSIGVADDRATGIRTIFTGTSNTGAHTHNTSGNTGSGGATDTNVAGTGATGSAGTGATGSAGSGNAHENRPPFLALNFIIYT